LRPARNHQSRETAPTAVADRAGPLKDLLHLGGRHAVGEANGRDPD
jgi:hypothetical protein